jgi:CDP-2,3-bis-(O-geranylgeranyl)-sn-glycerol synthase
VAWEGILRGLWLFLPAYVANMAPVLVAKVAPAWKAPIDGGRVGKDGQRILGDGKTWRGLVGGAVLGGLVALVVGWATPYPIPGVLAGWDYGWHGYCGGPINAPLDLFCAWQAASPAFVFLFGAVVGLFALAGDAVKSYFKRRLGKPGGAPWFPFDQLDFVVFGLLGMLAASPLLPPGWVWHALTDDWVVPFTIVVLTPAMHLAVNRIGYWLKLKSVPW